MSNSKISALTAATLPLDGTEVLPIVQSNATKKVTNNDLRPKQIQSNATSGVLQVAGPGAATTRVMTTPNANFTAARTDAAQTFTGNQTFDTSMALSAVDPDFIYTRYKTSVSGGPFFTMQRSRGASAGVNTIVQAGDWLGGIIWQGANGTGYSDAAYLYATVNGTPGASSDMPGAIRMATSADGSASPTQRFEISAAGDVTVSTGNLVIGTSGQGIDFSATPGTGTSELLADYEEGTFTPAYQTTNSNITYSAGTNVNGKYTKVGNMVFFSLMIRGNITGGTGNLLVTGLPFTAVTVNSAGCPCSISANYSWTLSPGNNPLIAGTNINLGQIAATDWAGTPIAASKSGSNSYNEVTLAGSYQVS
jgi:hypothetical protein